MSEQFQFLNFATPHPNFDAFTTNGYDHTLDYGKPQSFDYDAFPSDAVHLFPTQHLEQFDCEIDSSLAAFDAEVHHLPLDTFDTFTLLRTETPTRSVPSSFTVSSESVSAYDSGYGDSVSVHSESLYNFSDSAALSNEIDMDMKRLGLSPIDDNAFNLSSPGSSHSSPPIGVANFSPTPFSSRGSFSDYDSTAAVRIHVPSSSASDYYPHPVAINKYQSVTQATVSPANVSSQLPAAAPIQPTIVASQRSVKSESGLTSPNGRDPKRKYQCPSCPRAFARAYNLKTHIQTHDPNRSKPYACYHKSCGRSFSRKHDLTRHLISIHRCEAEEAVKGNQVVGVSVGNRQWCDSCGTSWLSNGKTKGCDCDDDK
ncbi:hypothetical protein EW026_g351 [Hermanssonia centrifuga]|uniref:C2H2-type domain-containing protein n=1 Tax=Hermanssonia centrifuga TaxID=98765 RepID=A0A4S4KZH1_9APHY|nr:hypothetical protein EW026_g351 [Hermanssonia centrifuga]